ncbi:hypothetical protein BVY01_03430 [bacterium I07]|nr:hypothetical protein BVY01_03430 [bacterium I07]
MMNKEQLLAFLSRMSPRDVEMLRQVLFDQPSETETESANPEEIGSDIIRTQITDDEFFENERTDVTETDGSIARVHNRNVWDCGHSQGHYPFGGIDAFGHVVCAHCLRWCDRGHHPCCVLDSKLLRNGKRACIAHRGLLRFFTRPTFKREF